jgi:hypothetical protein
MDMRDSYKSMLEDLKVTLDKSNSESNVNIITYLKEMKCELNRIHWRTLKYVNELSVSEIANNFFTC